MSAAEDQSQGPVVRDRRRIDPVTGQPRAAGGPQGQAAEPTAAGEPAAAQRPAGQPRPGKHAVSKPGTARPDAARTDKEEAKPETGAEADGSAGAPGPAEPQEAQPQEAEPIASAEPDLAAALAERTADVQRIQAEYANYRKRVERDRAAVREYAVAGVLAELLPVLDDIGRAREHGELTGGFKSVAEAFEAAVTKLGLTAFGDAGEPFDPKVHEALMHSYSPDVTETTCVQVLLPGYRVGDRILRPARVAVAEPSDPAGARPAPDAAEPGPEPEDEPDDGPEPDETT
jgi:molecular chaperone GrpE